MKTAEEWAKEIRHGSNQGGIDKTVKEIQLDAYTQGIRDAVKTLAICDPKDNLESYLISKSGLRL